MNITVRYAGVDTMNCLPPKRKPRTGRIWWHVSSSWNNVPQADWTFTIDGYPVIKKSLDYRHTETPRRPLRSVGVSYFSELIQYIAKQSQSLTQYMMPTIRPTKPALSSLWYDRWRPI